MSLESHFTRGSEEDIKVKVKKKEKTGSSYAVYDRKWPLKKEL